MISRNKRKLKVLKKHRMEFFSFIRIHLNLHGGKYTKSISLFLFSFVVPFSFFFLFSPLGHKCRMFPRDGFEALQYWSTFCLSFFPTTKTANPKAIKQHPIDHDLCGGRAGLNQSLTDCLADKPTPDNTRIISEHHVLLVFTGDQARRYF